VRQGTKRAELIRLLETSRIAPADDYLTNLYLYQPATILAKTLYLDELYRRVMHLPGDIFEFGVWWGANVSLFANLRSVYEPYNRVRKVVGFDTFTGYPLASANDLPTEHLAKGLYSVGDDYLEHLSAVLDAHESEGPTQGIKKYELIKGDVTETLSAYLRENPQCFVALAYVDLQTYEGTKAALSEIRPRLVPGSVLALDELTHKDYQGEAIAFREVFGTSGYTIEHSRFLPDRTLVTIC
jgi:hypothetical protein